MNKTYYESDHLAHWKYIKKYRGANGDWVYIYDRDRLGVKQFVDTKITGNAYKQHGREATDEAIKQGNRSASYLRTATDLEVSNGLNGKWDKKTDNEAKKYRRNAAAASYKADQAKKMHDELLRDYGKKSLAGFTSKHIRRGEKFISKFLHKSANYFEVKSRNRPF